ncbi:MULTISPECIES: Zn-dependent hydrolase [unclassified Bosea (in: a-proteobacteria)]|uniref:Zn-dependent hydrolase n=1 Tax=unclassified Bosea (in: a-proteobacteria) TaxID=2653178 RepID=UPI000F759E92|nr:MULTISPECIES: Zn-dependent hydrolase [unclassified Bosea (in: a-proteobacteria)]AZO77021.1 allantoate amidohydrolase [Bosea sp. Tri-49]RXT21867.1 allantoate amidohydrolase [Bosea sp. Tri-39]RXT32206.1 allantoate amidohydrolase [Bosea sp. Tri-54]
MTATARTARAETAIAQAVAAQRAWVETLFDRLAAGSRDEPGITRDTYGAGEDFGHRLLADHGKARGLAVAHDFAANTYVTLQGRDAAAPRILMGSHLDSVPHGGNFDGAAGVVAGLVVIETLRALGIRPRCDVTAIGVRAEESVWFQVSYIGSRSALGTLPDGTLEAKRIDDGRVLAASIDASGGDSAAIRRRERHLDPAAIRAFLEVHIEQAPSLVESGLPVAICTGVPGNFRYPDAQIVGRHDHVGTPRRFRRDAAMAGAEFAMLVDRLWQEEETAGFPMAVTLGRFHTDPAVHGLTTVPGSFAFSLDVRAYDPTVLERVEAKMLVAIREIEVRRRVTFDLGARASAAVGPVDPGIVAALEAAAARQGIATMPLGSPASHDSAAFAAAGVPIAMLFVRNEHGSHNPQEAMEIDDFLAACTILADWVAREVA